MEPLPQTAQVVSLAAVRESRTKNPTTPRENSTKQVDTPVDGVVDGQLTANPDQVDGQPKQVDTKLTPAQKAARWLQQPAMLDWLKSQYSPEEAATVLTGSLLLAAHIQPGEEARTVDIIKATVTEGISYRLLNDKCKPFLTHAKIWHKISGKEYRWANYKNPVERANDVRMSECNVRMDAEQRPNDQSRNPIDRLRHWQRTRYLERAKADVWKQVKEDGTVQAIPKPGQGAMTEKQKDLHRKAAWADYEAQLKLKIDQSGNKELAQQIQRADMEAVQQERAILNQARILAAEKRAQRQLLWERNKPLVYIGTIALIGFALYNSNPNTMQPMTATLPPLQGQQQ